MGTSQTISQIRNAIGEIDNDIQELNSMSMAISAEVTEAAAAFDSGQDYANSIKAANTCIDDALAELKKTRASLQAVAYALR